MIAIPKKTISNKNTSIDEKKELCALKHKYALEELAVRRELIELEHDLIIERTRIIGEIRKNNSQTKIDTAKRHQDKSLYTFRGD